MPVRPLTLNFSVPVARELAAAVRLQLANGGEAIALTLDAGTQPFAITALNDQLAELAGRQVEAGAVLVLENATGAVRACGASRARR